MPTPSLLKLVHSDLSPSKTSKTHVTVRYNGLSISPDTLSTAQKFHRLKFLNPDAADAVDYLIDRYLTGGFSPRTQKH